MICQRSSGHMAKSAKLLGSSIYEIQEVWEGPDELQQVNYALRSLPKGLKFLPVVPPLNIPKVMGLVGIHDPKALCHFNGMTDCPWCGKEGQNEGTVVNHLQMVHYRLTWCATNVTTTHQPHQTPSATMAGRTVNSQGKETPMSQPHQSNCQQETSRLNQ